MGSLQLSHFRLYGEDVRVRSCKGEGEGAKDATAKRRDAMAKCEGTMAKKRYNYRSFAFALLPSQLRTFAFVFFEGIQQVSVDYEFDDITVLTSVFRLIHVIIGTHVLGHRAYYECF